MQESDLPVIRVEAGDARIALWTSEEWSEAHNSLIPAAQSIVSRSLYWPFNDVHDLLINGFSRFVFKGNPKICPAMGCFWHYQYHVKKGFLDAVREHFNASTVSLDHIEEPDIHKNESLLSEDTPEAYMSAVEYNRQIMSLREKISKKGGHKNHMIAVYNALLIDDVGTKGTSISNEKLAKAAGLSIPQAVAAKRRLQRQGASND